MQFILALTVWIVLMSVVSCAAFYIDKQRATRGEWRVPERSLIMLALLGGMPGAKYAQRKFRHKTRKQPFATVLNVVMTVQIAGLLSVAFLVSEGRLHVPDLTDLLPAVSSESDGIPRRFGPGS